MFWPKIISNEEISCGTVEVKACGLADGSKKVQEPDGDREGGSPELESSGIAQKREDQAISMEEDAGVAGETWGK